MNINTFIDRLFEEAKKSEFTDFEVYYQGGDSFSVKVFEGKVDDYSVNATMGVSFRGMLNGKMGYSYTEAFDEDAIEMLINNAAENAKIIENEDLQFIFEGSEKYADIASFDAALANASTEEKIQKALKLEELAKKGDPAIVSVAQTSLQTGTGEIRIKNSKGLDISHKDNFFMCYTTPVAKDGDKMIDGMGYQLTKKYDEVDIEKVAKEVVENAVSKIGAKSVPSGDYKILFENDCFNSLLSTFENIFSAERTQKSLSLLKGKEGTKIAADCVTLVDDPLLDGGIVSSPFDGEGVATYTKNVIENGILKTLLHNLKTAKKDGVESTGNASKESYKASIGVSPFNFYIKKGEKTFDELCKTVGEGLIITDLMGLHSGANSVSGDFSLLAQGFKITDGKKSEPVEQITIAGNFYKVLEDIEHVGCDLKFGFPSSGCIGSPSIIVKSLSVAG